LPWDLDPDDLLIGVHPSVGDRCLVPDERIAVLEREPLRACDPAEMKR
jgi:hypothetical protein